MVFIMQTSTSTCLIHERSGEVMYIGSRTGHERSKVVYSYEKKIYLG